RLSKFLLAIIDQNQVIVLTAAEVYQSQVRFFPADAIGAFGISDRRIVLGFRVTLVRLSPGHIPHTKLVSDLEHRSIKICTKAVHRSWRPRAKHWVARIFLRLLQREFKIFSPGNGVVVEGKEDKITCFKRHLTLRLSRWCFGRRGAAAFHGERQPEKSKKENRASFCDPHVSLMREPVSERRHCEFELIVVRRKPPAFIF